MDSVLEALAESGKIGKAISEGYSKLNTTMQNKFQKKLGGSFGEDVDAVSVSEPDKMGSPLPV